MNEQEIHALIKKFIQGDRRAFEIIYDQIHQKVYRTVYFLATNKDDVNDLVSEVYIELFKSIERYNFESPFHSWINGLIIRQVNNWNRQSWRKLRLFHRYKELEIQPPNQHLDEMILANEENEELLQWVEHLSFKLKSVIVLRYYHDYTYDEIAGILCIPIGTVKSRHNQAILKLRQYVERLKKVKGESFHVS